MNEARYVTCGQVLQIDVPTMNKKAFKDYSAAYE
jgi:hypothetical protein